MVLLVKTNNKYKRHPFNRKLQAYSSVERVRGQRVFSGYSVTLNLFK